MKYNNIIIGAGPAGLQLAYYFQLYHIDYIILEKNNVVGSFYDKFPHNNKLLFPNYPKYDSYSLLSNYPFHNHSKLYPSRDEYFHYLQSFYTHHSLNIMFNQNVTNISFQESLFLYEIKTNDNVFYCDKLIIATGLSIHNIPLCKKYISSNNNIKHYNDFPKNYFIDQNNIIQFQNKSVLLVGYNNSSFELASILKSYTSHILITGNKKDFSINSFFDSDINHQFLDVYNDYIHGYGISFDNKILTDKNVIIESNNKYYIIGDNENQVMFCDSYVYFDYIIFCTNNLFDFSIFDKTLNITTNKNYPVLNFNYESVNNNKLFFIGKLMYGFNFKKNNSLFIKGFRYLIQLFFKKNYMLNFDKTLKYNNHIDLATQIYNRINTHNELFVMYNYIVDIFYFDNETDNVFYYKNISKFDFGLNIIDWNDMNYLCILKIDYDKLLYPVIEIYKKNDYGIFIFYDKIIINQTQFTQFDKIIRSIKFCINKY